MRRPRRNRATQAIRDLVSETQLTTDDFIFPLFLHEGKKGRIEIESMPGIYRQSEDHILREMEQCLALGIKGFLIFPVVSEDQKDTLATKSYDPNFFYLKTLKKVKETFPEAFVMTDVALDPYSSDGHDGLVKDGKILNDETLDLLGKMALEQAATGIDMIGPSDMMDSRVSFLRKLLDQNGYQDVGIMSYTAKYASAYYGPFRDALDSSPKFGDKKTYQMNPSNQKEALLEAQLDVEEGADVLMVKPALAYLDVIHQLQTNFKVPIAAYNVSGEYAMIKAADQKGWLDGEKLMIETLLSIKRAGASIILTYFSKEVASLLTAHD